MKYPRFWWALGMVLVLVALVVCLAPIPEIPGSIEVNDKLSHLVGHGSLALYFAGLVPRPRWWKVFLFLLVFGGVVELAQYLMQWGRDGDPRDIIANSAGALCGLLFAQLGLRRWPEFVERLLGQRRPAQ